ncbi:MAG: DJ-1/PfpI family protein [Planctomycetota bacterium]|jgi:transcriptional regulator GlxA family with amidase domain|nr:DJ-1/PfpI family protein [Planctomycetota bacterium]
MNVNCLLFNDFETLDLFGPVEVFGKVEEYSIKYYSMNGGNIISKQSASINTENADTMGSGGILLIPGGKGTRTLVNDNEFLSKLKCMVEKSAWCLTVCTGAALLAKTGLLDNCQATTNKIAFVWVKSKGIKVNWQDKARWCVDKKYYTSSGISAGIDMSIGFVFDRFGAEKAKEITKMMEYEWENNADKDPFVVGGN